jgi:hypothetical protein
MRLVGTLPRKQTALSRIGGSPLPSESRMPSPSSQSLQPPSLDGLDVEPTDFDSAPQALDDLPAGMDEVHAVKPGYWEARRRPTLPTDRALAGAALDWMVRLPPALRPRQLAERYPRVVNHIAETWTHPHHWEHTFDELLADTRGGRQGFPPELQDELKSLRRYREGLMVR